VYFLVLSLEAKVHALLLLQTPNSERNWSDKFNSFLAQCSSRYENILICGDFNLPKINWETLVQTTGVDEVAFTEQLNDFYLTQLNNLPTRGDNILYLVISSVANQVGNITTLDPTQS
jgi:hypothetical protein